MTIQQSGSEIDIRLSPRLKLKDLREFIDYLTFKEDIDIGDAPFIALAEYLNASLRTGDKVLLTNLKQGITRKLSVLKICSVYCFKDTPFFNSIVFDRVTPLPPPPKTTPEGERKPAPGNQSSAVPGRNLPLSIHHTHDPVPKQPEREISCLNIADHRRPAGCTAYIPMTCGIPVSNHEIRSFTPGIDGISEIMKATAHGCFRKNNEE